MNMHTNYKLIDQYTGRVVGIIDAPISRIKRNGIYSGGVAGSFHPARDLLIVETTAAPDGTVLATEANRTLRRDHPNWM